MWCETLPPGNHLRTRERLRARGAADEGRRVHERGDEPAGVWERHGNRCRRPPHPRRPRADRGRRREGQSRQAWAWARGAVGHRRAAPGADGEGGGGAMGDRGDRGGARVGQLAGGDGRTGGERGSGRTRGGGARAMVAGETRQFAVGHARGAFPGAVIREGASRGVGQLAVGQFVAAGGILRRSPGAGVNPQRGAPMGERGRSGRVTRGPAAGGWTASSRRYIPSPGGYGTTCICIYKCSIRTFTTTHCRIPAHT